jgi:hypothetical protein
VGIILLLLMKRNSITVLLGSSDFERFESYCNEKGFKKSTLIARLVREHLGREGFHYQPSLLETHKKK